MVGHALIQQGFHAFFTRVRQRTFRGGALLPRRACCALYSLRHSPNQSRLHGPLGPAWSRLRPASRRASGTLQARRSTANVTNRFTAHFTARRQPRSLPLAFRRSMASSHAIRYGYAQTRQASRPSVIRSCGKSMPIKTILLVFFSAGCHLAARSLPIIWCTPWNTTLRSTPFI